MCKVDEFQCADGTCIEEFRKCDKYDDCVDGTDELNCGKLVDDFSQY